FLALAGVCLDNYDARVIDAHSLFFFSSRRRHTRSKRDWSSDVCSSDLGVGGSLIINNQIWHGAHLYGGEFGFMIIDGKQLSELRSEERRVGKEGRCRMWPRQQKSKNVVGGCGS